MTYDELLELGKKLTRSDGRTNYIGVMPPDLRQMYWQYGVRSVMVDGVDINTALRNAEDKANKEIVIP
jgi:hypothetical protein